MPRLEGGVGIVYAAKIGHLSPGLNENENDFHLNVADVDVLLFLLMVIFCCCLWRMDTRS